jgi:hypothetical protein
MDNTAPSTQEATPVPDTPRTRWVTAILSMGVFAVIGGWLGDKIGAAGDHNSQRNTQKFMRWAGAAGGALLALASQPKPLSASFSDRPEDTLPPVTPQCGKTRATTPLTSIEAGDTEPQGPLEAREKTRA